MPSKRGRKQKRYTTSWGEIIPGLAKLSDGRWKILANGHRWTEPDERLAVKQFAEWTAKNQPPQVVKIAASSKSVKEAMDKFHARLTVPVQQGRGANVYRYPQFASVEVKEGTATMTQEVDSPILWGWLPEQLLERHMWQRWWAFPKSHPWRGCQSRALRSPSARSWPSTSQTTAANRKVKVIRLRFSKDS